MTTQIVRTVAALLLLLNLSALRASVNVQANSNGTRFTGVLVNGSTTAKYDIVFVGDGFTSSPTDQKKFNDAVDQCLVALRNKAPYDRNICAFNIWRVNVISAQSGIDLPLSNTFRNTELNCTFGDNVAAPARVIYSSTPEKVTEAADYAPGNDATYVLVNDATYGGAAGSIVYTSLNTAMSEVVVHELGHFTGHLADEYTCYWCDGRVEPPYSGPEPSQANITIQTNRSQVKWASLIAAATPLPTTVNSPAGVVGLWQGGYYSPTGIYRPQQNCLMRSLNNELCQVCKNALSSILRSNCTTCEREPGSVACLVSKLRPRLVLYKKPLIFEVPLCCYCPLDGPSRAEMVINVNPERYKIELTDETGAAVRAGIRSVRENITLAFEQDSNKKYFLKITPNGLLRSETVNVSLVQNGQRAAIF